MSLGTYGWLVLAFPLGGSLLIALTFRALPDRVHGWLGTLAILLSFLSAVGMFIKLRDLDPAHRQVVVVGWNYAKTVGIDARVAILIDPLSVLMALIVMVVAACEVAVGLGLVVALYRRRLPIDVDELRELQG